MVTFAVAARFIGLGLALVALIIETLRLRAPGTLPIARLMQREWRVPGRSSEVVTCFAAGLLLVAAPVTWSIALGSTELTRDPRWSATTVALMATVAVKLLWVLFEELAFRAALIRVLASHVAVPVAIAVSAAAFAASHGRDAMSAAVLAVDGIGFGVAYVATGSIRAPIAWHVGKNLAVWIVGGQSTMQLASLPWRHAGPTTATAVDLSFAVVVVGLTSLVLLLKHQVSPSGRIALS